LPASPNQPRFKGEIVMTTQGPRILDDMSRLAGGAMGALGGLRGEIEEMVRQRVERMAHDLDLVTREDFEAVREMAAEARAENEALSARLRALEEQLGTGGTGA
jgi:BMFP domain-containing protein YqiC